MSLPYSALPQHFILGAQISAQVGIREWGKGMHMNGTEGLGLGAEGAVRRRREKSSQHDHRCVGTQAGQGSREGWVILLWHSFCSPVGFGA